MWAENLSQTNPGGTLLNDETLAQKRLLADGDVLSICGRRFRFEYNVPSLDDRTVAVGATRKWSRPSSASPPSSSRSR